MSTRSNIMIENSDGSIDSIFCHWDGYPGYVGKILENDYRATSKVKELIKLGSLDSLGPVLASSPLVQKYGVDWDFLKDYSVKNEHHKNRDHLNDEILSIGHYFTTAYHRDLGEDWDASATLHFKTLQDEQDHDDAQEFLYLFIPNQQGTGQWYCQDIWNQTGFEPLARMIAKDPS